MKSNYGNMVCIMGLLLTALGSIVFSGCGDDDEPSVGVGPSTTVVSSGEPISVPLPKLVASPNEYKGQTVKVYGKATNTEQGDTTFLVLIVIDDYGIICEFLTTDPQPLSLENYVTISGKVDILAGITFLRECEIKED